jgi:dipeptidase
MCDTQVLIGEDAVWFAKNSDREPSEPQPVVRLPAVRDDTAPPVRTTYLEVPGSAQRHAVLLSKPVWCWGAEMGVNEHGVAIGNEAIFSRRATTTGALLGMDLVRLGLERGASADEALFVITTLLGRHRAFATRGSATTPRS